MDYAKKLGYRIKHLGIARQSQEGIEMRVHPTFVPEEHLMSHVHGVMNAIMVNGDAVGQTMHYGAGAGAEPTASSVVADLVEVVRTLTVDPENRVPHLAFQPETLSDTPILPMEKVITSYYLCVQAENRPGVLAEITQILGESDISIEAILQKEISAEVVPVVILTHKVLEGNMNKAINRLTKLDGVHDKIKRIRLEGLE